MSKQHAYELIGIIDDSADLLKKLEKWMERRQRNAGRILNANEIESELDRYKPGNTYGRYHERIIRREIRTDGIPEWFDPREHLGQCGIITKNGRRIYIEVELNTIERAKPSVFDRKMADLVERIPEQTSLLEIG